MTAHFCPVQSNRHSGTTEHFRFIFWIHVDSFINSYNILFFTSSILNSESRAIVPVDNGPSRYVQGIMRQIIALFYYLLIITYVRTLYVSIKYQRHPYHGYARRYKNQRNPSYGFLQPGQISSHTMMILR